MVSVIADDGTLRRFAIVPMSESRTVVVYSLNVPEAIMVAVVVKEVDGMSDSGGGIGAGGGGGCGSGEGGGKSGGGGGGGGGGCDGGGGDGGGGGGAQG